MQSDEDTKLMRDVRLGIDAEAFLNSDLGKHLQSRADADLEAGFRQFLTANPTDVAQITQIQTRCLVAMNFKQWLLDAINSGRYAEMELKEHVE